MDCTNNADLHGALDECLSRFTTLQGILNSGHYLKDINPA